MIIDFPCGKNKLSLRMPGHTTVIEGALPSPLSDPTGAVRRALADPLNSPSLSTLARGRKNACVVVSDKTRPVPNRIILPVLMEELKKAGLSPDMITILVATGMHAPTAGVDLVDLLGEEITGKYRIINHDCHDADSLVELDRIEGQPICVNRNYLESDLKIVTGLIEPHSFAGYSGGGKSILPGLTGFEGMKLMHSFKLVQDPRLANCRIFGNPFQEHIRAIAGKAGIDFLVNVLIDKHKRMVEGVFAGEFRSAHNAGCRAAGGFSRTKVDGPCDLVVTSGGGYPLDTTFYQATKGLTTCWPILAPNTRVIFIAGCSNGLGSPDYRSIFEAHQSVDSFKAHYSLSDHFTMDQWGAQRFYQSRERFSEIWIHCPGLTDSDHRLLGVSRAESVQKTLDRLLLDSKRPAAMPEGPYVEPYLEGNAEM